MKFERALRRANVHNSNQGPTKRVLCVCSAGILRSATASHVLASTPYEYNTRAVGIKPYALVPIDDVLIAWADEIVCMDKEHVEALIVHFGSPSKPVICLDIPDDYEYRQPELVQLIKTRYEKRSKTNVG